MTAALWVAVGAVAWLVVALLVARLLGGAIQIRNRQVPDTSEDQP